MDLIFDPSQPNAQLVTDGMVIRAGKRFSVPDARGRSLIGQLHPDVREAPAPSSEQNPVEVSVASQTAPVPAPPRPRFADPRLAGHARPPQRP